MRHRTTEERIEGVFFALAVIAASPIIFLYALTRAAVILSHGQIPVSGYVWWSARYVKYELSRLKRSAR
jgi:hypothetical protein